MFNIVLFADTAFLLGTAADQFVLCRDQLWFISFFLPHNSAGITSKYKH